MKKSSKSLSLVLMGSLTVTMGGCASEETTEDFRAYRSIDECVNEQIFTPQECRDMVVAAINQNPQFTDKAACENEFGAGNCEQNPNGQAQNVQGQSQGSSWMPLLAGYMMGRYLGGGGMMQSSQPLYRQPQAAPGAAQPGAAAARTSGGFANSFRTLGGGSIQPDARGIVNNPPQSVRQGFAKVAKPYVGRTGTGSRGGFFGGRSAT